MHWRIIQYTYNSHHNCEQTLTAKTLTPSPNFSTIRTLNIIYLETTNDTTTRLGLLLAKLILRRRHVKTTADTYKAK